VQQNLLVFSFAASGLLHGQNLPRQMATPPHVLDILRHKIFGMCSK
jgi:hypothetical protein